VANIKSQIKRNRQNEKRRLRNKSVKSSLKTAIRKFHEATAAGVGPGRVDERPELVQFHSRHSSARRRSARKR
jgi:ribosomal protein S20